MSRDAAANAVGFRIAAIALTGPEGSQPRRGPDHRRRDRTRVAACSSTPTPRASASWPIPGSPTRRCSSSIPTGCRSRSPSARLLRSGRRTAGSASSPPTAPCSNRSSRTAISACRSWSDAAPSNRPRISSPSLDRYPDIRAAAARLDPGRRAALESAAQERHRRAAAGDECRAGARSAGGARPRQEAPVARHHRRSICACPTA